jgi:hypothetical protein
MSNFDLVEGEEIILRAKLRKDRWMKWRCVTCSCRCIATVYLAPLCVPIYALFGDSCREEEADSFELILTNMNLHCRQMLYGCGMCCQQSGSKVIPLDRIQDISLNSDWVGDRCGIVDTPGEAYQIQVQTAAMGTMMPELVVVSIENPREFKKAVLEAKNRLKGGAPPSAGHGKTTAEQQLASASPEDLRRILDLLQRQTQEPTAPTAP